ncbi:MAG: phage Gp37/Gp68 family protein [Treponema sp.]|nr:phage Gp37/Gp68 family protein [Treponema sp.]
MNKTRIDWCDMTWNPVTGCLHGCPYCYAKKIVQRFGKNPDEFRKLYSLESEDKTHIKYISDVKIGCYPWGFEPTLYPERLNQPTMKKKTLNIFVCSMADLFGAWVPDEWIEEVFKACARAPQHRYLFLTKNPDRYREINDYIEDVIAPIISEQEKDLIAYFGATVTNSDQFIKAYESDATWVSIEPLLDEIDTDNFSFYSLPDSEDVARWHWVVIGAETGNRKDRVVPKREWIEEIVEACRFWKTPVFMKSSLREIWGEPLIQEYPWRSDDI